jgi:hypothetical protein
LNTWVHLIGVLDPTTGQTRLYVNGTRQSNLGVNARGFHTTSAFEVGAMAGIADFFGGQIDQVKVFAGAMTDREAASLSGFPRQIIVNPAGGRCFDVNGGNILQIYDCHGGNNQKFVQRTDGTIFNPPTGKCLDGSSLIITYQVFLNTCTGAANQVFQYRADGTIYSPAGNLCFDLEYGGTANATKVMLYTCHGMGNQVFTPITRQ